jgi:O-antigen ligase
MPVPTLNWSCTRQAIVILGLFGLLWFSWASHARTLFNGLASPLFIALATYLAFLATQYKITVTRSSLLFFLVFSGWVIIVDAGSGEFLPALAKDSHWLILPLACLLIAQVFREYPRAFEFVQIGAALCIVNLLATMFVMAEWFDNWHYPPIFGHIRHLGLSVGFLSLILFTRTASSTLIAVFFRVTRILGLALVFWSGTRASILAWVICIVVFVALDRSWLKTLLIDTAIAIALALIVPPPFPVNQWTPGTIARTVEELTGKATSATAASSMRLGLWQTALSALSEGGHLWTGLGGNGFARLQTVYGVEITPRGHAHPHNVVVQAICDWGLIGTGLLAALLLNSVLRPIATRLKSCNPTAVAGIVYLLVTGMFDATLFHLEHLFYLMIAIAYWIGTQQQDASNKVKLPSGPIFATILGLTWLHLQTLDYRIGLYWYFPTV